MLVKPKVLICIVASNEYWGMGDTLKSILDQDYLGEIQVVVLTPKITNRDMYPAGGCVLLPEEFEKRTSYKIVDGSLPGGMFLVVLQTWLAADAKYLCYMQAGNTIPPNRINTQVEYMQGFSLAGCYGDVISSVRPATEEQKVIYRSQNFVPDMIGMNSFDTQTLMVDKEKFFMAGGFDHALYAGYRPNSYLIAFTAVSGKMRHIDHILLEKRHKDILRDSTSIDDIDGGRDCEMWKRIRFESLVMRSREFYRKREEGTWV